jgi:hypothetical protein
VPTFCISILLGSSGFFAFFKALVKLCLCIFKDSFYAIPHLVGAYYKLFPANII